MSAFLRTVPGRVLTLSGGFAMTGGGIAVLLGHSLGTPVMCLSLLAGIVSGVFATGLASGEWPGHALAAVLGLPVALFVYVLGLSLAVQHHVVAVGYVLIPIGLLALSRAALLKPAAEEHHAIRAHAEHGAH